MNNKLSIFLFIDAMGWKIVRDHDFMTDIFPHRRSIEMQFGYSSSAIPTILSGAQPDTHGHLGLFRYDPLHSPFRRLAGFSWLFSYSPFWNRGRVRHHLSKIIKKIHGYTGYFQLYQMPIRKLGLMDYCEKYNLFIPGGMEDTPNLADLLEKTQLNYHISDWHLTDLQNFQAGEQAVQRGCDFLFLYTAELDGLLHYQVTHDDIIEQKLQFYRRQILKLMETAAKTGRELSFTVFSDHGMTPLIDTVDIMSTIEKLNLHFGKDYGACYDSTMARFYFHNSTAEKLIRTAMENFSDQGHFVTQSEEKHYGIYRKDRAFGDMIFLLKPGLQIIPSDMGAAPLPGMHGYAPEDINSQAAIMSDRPLPENIRKVADYFSLMKKQILEMKVPA